MSKRKRQANPSLPGPSVGNAQLSQLIKASPSVPKPKQDFSVLKQLPATYQALNDLAEKGPVDTFGLRRETFVRIERITGRPLISYVAQTSNIAQGVPAHIEDSDLIGFDDLVRTTDGPNVDVFLISNGGSAEASERIVKLLRGRFTSVRFIVPANAYSAATLICLSGDEILMGASGTLGPIDPQIGGIPTRAILRAFDQVKEQLKQEGPKALPAYAPLLNKYDLHILEMCKSAEELSKELAETWLSTYMLKCDRADPRVATIVQSLTSYDHHKSHARGVDRGTARSLGINVTNTETVNELDELVRSLRNQYAFFIEMSPFYKLFENARGINWGRKTQEVTIQLPPNMVPQPQPGPPRRSS